MFSRAAHRDAWAMRIQGRYDMLERDEWEARGADYAGARGPQMIGAGQAGFVASLWPDFEGRSGGRRAQSLGGWRRWT